MTKFIIKNYAEQRAVWRNRNEKAFVWRNKKIHKNEIIIHQTLNEEMLFLEIKN